MRRFLVVLAVLFLLSASGIAWGQVQYNVIDLGTLPGGTGSEAYGINSSGQVAGWAYTSSGSQHSFLYSGGTMRDLGTLPGGTYSYASAINNSGQVVGYADASGGASHGFLYSGGSMQDLGTFGGPNSYAFAINNSGQIAGQADTSSGNQLAYVCSNGSMQSLGTLGGPDSQALRVNDSGQVVGWANIVGGNGTDTNGFHAFLFSGASMQDLGTFGGPNSYAIAINNSGRIAGWADTSDGGVPHAYVHNGNGPLVLTDDIDPLGWSECLGINNSGLAVGTDYDTNNIGTLSGIWAGYHAFVYSGEVMQDLNSLIPANSGWTLQVAYGVNDSGQICGWGQNPNGHTDAFLLDPISTPEPSTLALLAAGAVSLAGYAWRRKHKRASLASKPALVQDDDTGPAIVLAFSLLPFPPLCRIIWKSA